MNAVPCIKWIRRGVAKRNPDRVKLDPDELKRLIQSHGEDLEALALSDGSDDEDQGMQETPGSSGGTKRKMADEEPEEKDEDSEKSEEEAASSDEDVVKKYGLDEYDKEEDGENAGMGFSGISKFASNEDDPYVEDGEDSEAEELEILPEDNLVAVAKVQGDYNTLELHVYEESKSNMYCHHDVLLPTFPLAIEWLNFDPSSPTAAGNFLAMGSMESNIDVWDLDLIDAMEPSFILAGASKKKGKKKKKVSVAGHRDAVLALSWNRNQRQVLASGSADFTVGLWDLSVGNMVTSIKHEEKVQSVEWHPVEPQSLLTGSFDQEVKIFDCRSPENANKKWEVSGEVETAKWNIHDPYYFLVSTDDGNVSCIDVRASDPVITWQAHEKSTTGLVIDHHIPGCLVSVSSDRTLRVWDIRNSEAKMVLSKNLSMGELHSVDLCPDSSLLVAVGGEREHRVINLKKNPTVTQYWNLDVEKGEEETIGESVKYELSDESDIDDAIKEEAAAVEKAPKKKKKKKTKKKKTDTS